MRSDQDLRHAVTTPFAKGKVPVIVDIHRHPAIAMIARWGPSLKAKIADACFANYNEKAASIGPETLPRIRKPSEVWKHLEIVSLRVDPTVDNIVVLYVVPGWDEDEHMEWCIRGTDEVIYVGQFLGYFVDGYAAAKG